MADFSKILAAQQAKAAVVNQSPQSVSLKTEVSTPILQVSQALAAEAKPIIPASLSNADQIIDRIAIMQKQLAENAPAYEYSIQVIHKELLKDPDVCHLLNDEQIGVIVSALSKRKGIVLAEAAIKGKKKLTGLSLDDF